MDQKSRTRRVRAKKYASIVLATYNPGDPEGTGDTDWSDWSLDGIRRGDWTIFRLMIFVGAQRAGGCRLSQGECQALLEVLEGKRPFPSRRDAPDIGAMVLAKTVADYSRLLESQGMKAKAAVSRTCELYGVGRSTVFSARKSGRVSTEFWLEGCTPEQRQTLIVSMEQSARRSGGSKRSPE